MKKYNKKLILDYVFGNDIEDFSIDELEDNYEFMMEVIKYTKDKRIYDLCSERVKNNYEFVKFMIETFKSDIDFVTNLTLSYLKKLTDDDIRYKELVILTSSLKGDNDNVTVLKLKRSIITTIELGSIEQAIEECNHQQKLQFGLGFIFIIDNYGNSEILKNYFANKFIEKIFFNDNITLEQFIHKRTKNFEIIKQQGVNNYLINLIRNYDCFLADYIVNHIEIIDSLVKQIYNIGNNWNNYIENINRRRIAIINQEIFKYIEENKIDMRFSVYDLMKSLIKKYGLEEVFEEYDNFIIEDGVYKYFEEIDKNKLDFNELKCYTFLDNLFDEIFKEDIINQSNQDEQKKYNGNSKVIKFIANN